MKIILALLLLLLTIAIGVARSQDVAKNVFNFPFMQNPTATINKHAFSLIVVKEAKDVEIGLSNKTSLPQDQAMLFVFKKEDIYPFWMRDMKFPLDIIFIKDDKIVTISQNAQPPTSPSDNVPVYKPMSPVNKVLEINAGLSKKYDIKEGNVVQFKNL